MSHLDEARTLVSALRSSIDRATAHLAGLVAVDGRVDTGLLDRHQAVAYDVASLGSAAAAAERLVRDGELGEAEAALALGFAADVAGDLHGRGAGRWEALGLEPDGLLASAAVRGALRHGRDPGLLEAIAERVLATGEAGPRHLDEDQQMVRDTFRRFVDERVRPVAERIHRNDEDVPHEIIEELAGMGAFALSIPAEYGGVAEGREGELADMVLVTEELTRGSLAVAGSLITRPEIVSTALLAGGTEQQKQRWLPGMAAGETMCAVAVTEPDRGSDVAGLETAARRHGDGWVIDGVKTWCTFAGRADVVLVLARTDPDRSTGHRGLSLFLVEKPPFDGHAFRADQDGGGSIEGRAIPTIGYRGLHSFEVSFDGWRVPGEALVGGEDGLGQGFYLQMRGFSTGRLQTAARANGLMQAAMEAAAGYAAARHVFGRPLADYQLSRAKLARMALLLAASRSFAFDVARALPAGGGRGAGTGQLAASQVKQRACLWAEWVTREAQQLHGGYGYAEEFAVSRYFLDARVLSIFEGADEVLALRVIARGLLRAALAGDG